MATDKGDENSGPGEGATRESRRGRGVSRSRRCRRRDRWPWWGWGFRLAFGAPVDGEQLRQNPVETLHELQRFLKITPAFNYSSHLRYDPKKGFFCQVTNEDRTKCLGKSKGRQYPPMEDKSYKLLQVRVKFYRVVVVTVSCRENY